MYSNTNKHTADNLVLQRLNRGEEEAFDYFFHRLFPLMRIFADRILADTAIAEEVVQDAFFKVWERRDTFQDTEGLKAFLYVAIRNASLNELSKRKNRVKYQENFALDSADVEPPVLAEIIRTEVLASLSEAIQTLPAQCRRIIQLLFEADLSPAEIAALLDISVSTVNSQKARGIALLRQRLGGKNLDLFLMLLAIRGIVD